MRPEPDHEKDAAWLPLTFVMPFPLETKEQIYSDICAAGAALGPALRHPGHVVVAPEFFFQYHPPGVAPEETKTKMVDIAWIVTLDHLPWQDGLPQYRVLAAFEIDGYDVPFATITHYSDVYPLIRTHINMGFHCYVPLFSRATHRPKFCHRPRNVQRAVAKRQNMRELNGANVTVCDGATRDWLTTATVNAENEIAGMQMGPL